MNRIYTVETNRDSDLMEAIPWGAATWQIWAWRDPTIDGSRILGDLGSLVWVRGRYHGERYRCVASLLFDECIALRLGIPLASL
jgi:hypothetical protein